MVVTLWVWLILQLVSIQKWLFFPWATFSACFRVPVPLKRGDVLMRPPLKVRDLRLAQRKNPSFLNWKLSYCPSTLKTISGWTQAKYVHTIKIMLWEPESSIGGQTGLSVLGIIKHIERKAFSQTWVLGPA
jgi:hypothetical protein